MCADYDAEMQQIVGRVVPGPGGGADPEPSGLRAHGEELGLVQERDEPVVAAAPLAQHDAGRPAGVGHLGFVLPRLA
jgi:hypothetical protein